MPPFRRSPDSPDSPGSSDDDSYASPWAPPRPLRQETSAAAPAAPRERQWGEPERAWLEDQPTMPLPLQRPARQEAPVGLSSLGEDGDDCGERRQELDDGSPFWVWPEQADTFIENGFAPQQLPPLVRRWLQLRTLMRRAAEGAVRVVPAVAAEGLERAVESKPTSATQAPGSQPLATARRPRELTHPSVMDDLLEATTRAWRKRRGDPRIADVIRELHEMKVERVGEGAEKRDSAEFSERTLQRKLHELLGPGDKGTWAGWLNYWRERRPEQ